MTAALFDLVGESAAEHLVDTTVKPKAILARMDFSALDETVEIDEKFLDRPADLPVLEQATRLLGAWLKECGVAAPAAEAISYRLPTYFVYALNREWRKNAKSYQPLIDAIDTPFAKAGEREWAWNAYTALLQRRIEEGVFDEPFSLLQIYVPLNAYYLEDDPEKDFTEETRRLGRRRRRTVVDLEKELSDWIDNPKQEDAIRVISGGPGCGKSCFARVFAARQASKGRVKVLFIPLHLIDPTRDIEDEVARFVRDEGILQQNPLDPESPEPDLLLIFDGLDELASLGKAAAETARAFIREVERTVDKRNSNTVRLRVLISGRELIVQENESEFRRTRQILNILPYYVAEEDDSRRRTLRPEEQFHDPDGLLKEDLRQKWWTNYGQVTGRAFESLPKELSRVDLEEITAQPLLNYLVALSYTRGKLDFGKDVNLNAVYEDLVAAVHERAYEKKRRFAPIRHMKLDEFVRVLEEVGLAAWHGDGRTTTVREIEEHCRASGVGTLLDKFTEGAEAGVTRLLAAFFFRQYGRRASGDPTFVFTHKSFGEYLAARRVVRAVERITREIQCRRNDPDSGWSEREALVHWAQLCGPTAISEYLHRFLLDEMRLRNICSTERYAEKHQEYFTHLFNNCLRCGMPMEQLQLSSFRVTCFQARNCEEALLVALNACATLTQKVSKITPSTATAFGAWFKRIQGQRSSHESVLAAQCLSWLGFRFLILDIGDLYNTNLSHCDFTSTQAYYACFVNASLMHGNLERAIFREADLHNANLQGANLKGANFQQANLEEANLEEANLQEAGLLKARCPGAMLYKAHLQNACLEGADLRDANLEGADLRGANLKGADLRGANLKGADLRGANLEGANLEGADLRDADLDGANLEGANLEGARLPK